MSRSRWWLILAIAISASACAPTPSVAPSAPTLVTTAPLRTGSTGSDFTPTYATTACPEEITLVVVGDLACGYLTVLENRSKPLGRTLRLFVVEVQPPNPTDPPGEGGPGPGDDLAAPRDFGGAAPGAQRTHRPLYLMDERGVGRSEPDLDCPEVHAAAPSLVGLRLRDPAHRETLLEAVKACHERLVAAGIDLASYDTAAILQDHEDLRIALGLPSINVGSNDNGSRLGLEYVSRYPAAVRSFAMDSPSLVQPDLLTLAPEALDLSIARLATACAAESSCATRAPHLDRSIRDAVARLDASPITLDVTDTALAAKVGHSIRVVVDGAALLRFIRAELGSLGSAVHEEIVRTVLDVLAGRLDAASPAVRRLASDPGDCLGLLPACDVTSLGALYSLVCRDIAPGVDHRRLQVSMAGRAEYADLFDPGPLLTACGAWDVPPAAPTAEAFPSSLPTLVMRGWFDPYSAPPTHIKDAFKDRPDVYFYEVPNESYNAFGFSDCPRLIRNAWIDAIDVPPADTSCLSTIAPPLLGP
jgi:pimeloyl-ACP methyl ester carboxylesterase